MISQPLWELPLTEDFKYKRQQHSFSKLQMTEKQNSGCSEMWLYTFTSSIFTGVYPMIRELWEERKKFSWNFPLELVTLILRNSMLFRKTLLLTHHVTHFHLPFSMLIPFPFSLWLVRWCQFLLSFPFTAHFFTRVYAHMAGRWWWGAFPMAQW